MSGFTLAGSLRSHGLSSSVSGPQLASLALSATPPTYVIFMGSCLTGFFDPVVTLPPLGITKPCPV